jgi:hypothetical protein
VTVTGVLGTTALGTATVNAGAKVYPTGVSATGYVNSTVLIWVTIDDYQNPNWMRIAA